MEINDALDQLDLISEVAIEHQIAAGRLDNTDQARLEYRELNREALRTVVLFVSGDTNTAAAPSLDSSPRR